MSPSPQVSGSMAVEKQAPECEIRVISSSVISDPLRAVLDTGASKTVLPESIKKSLDPRRRSNEQVKLRFANTGIVLTNIYILDIEINGHLFTGVDVVFIPHRTEDMPALIGRNLLDNHKLVLNWKSSIWQMNCNLCDDCS